jgi:NAD(P)H dehydrogenase (quinone)
MEKLLVTGATGHLGKSVVKQLLKFTTPENIAILARNSAKADYFRSKGIDMRIGDYDDFLSLGKALIGIDKVLLISGTDPFTRLQQQINVIDAAQNAGVKHVVYTGVSIKNPDNSANMFLIQSHFRTEG